VKSITLLALATTVVAATAGAAGNAPSLLVTRDVYLMGTRATISTYAETRAEGLATLESALTSLEDTEAELSTWRPTSAVSLLNRQTLGEPWFATLRLCRMFTDVWEWQRSTGGAFDPTIGRLLDAWDIHGIGRIPSAAARASALASSGIGHFSFDAPRCTVTRTADATFDVGAFGKGEALDRVSITVGDDPWMVNLGGQVSVGGRRPETGVWTVTIADPRHRDRAVVELQIASGSLATSAGSERDLIVEGTRVGHILDPRTGLPVTFDGSVTVWHERGLAADALSTALFVMGPDQGLQWSEARGLAVLYLIPEQGGLRVASTRAFRPLLSQKTTAPE